MMDEITRIVTTELSPEQLLRLEALHLADNRINGDSRYVLKVADEWAKFLLTGNLPDEKAPS